MEFIVTGHPVSIDHSTVIFVVFRFQNARDNDQAMTIVIIKKKPLMLFTFQCKSYYLLLNEF